MNKIAGALASTAVKLNPTLPVTSNMKKIVCPVYHNPFKRYASARVDERKNGVDCHQASISTPYGYWWGKSMTIDLYDCDPKAITCRDTISSYSKDLCELIKMKRYGEPIIVNFGEGNKAGYTLVQLISTSNVTGHFSNELNTAYIDIFSCKDFDWRGAAEFSAKYFGSKGSDVSIALRGRLPLTDNRKIRIQSSIGP